MKRREFLKRSVAVLGSTTLCSKISFSAVPKRKPNIIFVFADQMRSNVLGCYGNRQFTTPNIDSIAANGALFSNAISTYPVCSPYRAMLMTGLYPMKNHVVANDTQLRDDVPTIAKVCKANGYSTGYIGKWHLESNRERFVPKHRRMGFDDFWASENCKHDYLDCDYCGDTPERKIWKGYKPRAQTQMAIDFMEAHKENPFCLFLSWDPPHDPYVGPEEYMKQFEPDKIMFASNVSEHKMVDWLLATDPAKHDAETLKRRSEARVGLCDDKKVKAMQQGYFALTKSLDDCMGMLLKTLRQCGLEKNTILAFSSDHGDMLGSHRMGSKQMPFQESISIPLLMQYPAKMSKGIRSSVLLAPIDVMPTLLGLAELKCPRVDGLDLSDAAMGAKTREHDALLIMKMVHGGIPYIQNGVTPWRGIRTKQYTYARLMDRGEWVLFDNKRDPHQLNNLIESPEYAGILVELRAKMEELLEKANDPVNPQEIENFRQSLI